MTLADLAKAIGCVLEPRSDGDAAVDVTRLAALDDAGPGDVTFLSNPRYAAKLRTTRASAVIAGATVAGAPCAVLRAERPYLAVAEAVARLTPAPAPVRGISPLASIDPTAIIGPDVSIGPFVAIGAQARVGARTVIHPHVVIGTGASIGADGVLHAHVSVREHVELGDRVVVQNGAVIGSDGYGFADRPDGSHQKIPQVGRVVIEDDVEIGALTAIDRPAIGETRIAAGAKLDNLVQIAHGVRVGRHVLLAAQVGIAGSTVLEDGVRMGGQSGAAGHLRLGKGVTVNAKTAVTKDVPDGRHVAGIPAGDVARWREATVLARRLPALRRAIADLERRLRALEK